MQQQQKNEHEGFNLPYKCIKAAILFFALKQKNKKLQVKPKLTYI